MNGVLELQERSGLIKNMPFVYGIFGGAVRSWLFGRKPRDIDVVVDCSREELDYYIESSIDKDDTSSNRFGGFKVKDGGVELDIWPLSETWNIQNEKVSPTFENLVDYASFNVDCVAYVIQRIYPPYLVCADFFMTAINAGVVEVNYAPNPIAPYNAMRGLRICKTYNWKPGQSLINYVKEHVNDKNRPILELRYKKSYGEEIGDLWKMAE